MVFNRLSCAFFVFLSFIKHHFDLEKSREQTDRNPTEATSDFVTEIGCGVDEEQN
jgi:hypothetical protein